MTERKMWDEKEDNMIGRIVRENQKRSQEQKWKWSQIAEILQKRIPGCRRSGKQCRQRWYNHLNPNIIKDRQLSRSQIDKLFELQNKMGNRWANIAKQFPGRTDNNLKNFFYSSLRRAIRQINFYVAHYKKKSNIKPFKQSILTKILNINDQKYRQKLDIKNQIAEDLAKNVKQMLARLSLEPQDQQLTSVDLQFREKIVKSIQDFNKNCKKRKSKRVQEQQQPDLEDLSQYKNSQSEEMQSPRTSKKKPKKQTAKNQQKQVRKVKSKQKQQEKRRNKKNPKANTYQMEIKQEEQPSPLFKNPRGDGQPLNRTRNEMLKQNSILDDDNAKSLSKKRSSKNNSSSQNNLFNLQSSLNLNSNHGYLEQPALMTRRSSQYKGPLSFVPAIYSKMSKNESKNEGSLFSHFPIPDNLMMESINIGQTINKIESSVNESGFLKLSKYDSKTSQNNAN